MRGLRRGSLRRNESSMLGGSLCSLRVEASSSSPGTMAVRWMMHWAKG